MEAFQRHASCMVNQYANFSVAGTNVRETFVLLLITESLSTSLPSFPLMNDEIFFFR